MYSKERNIDRKKLLGFIFQLTGAEKMEYGKFIKVPLTDGSYESLEFNIYGASTRNWYTISLTGCSTGLDADDYHYQIVDYLRSLNLKRNILFQTNNITTQV